MRTRFGVRAYEHRPPDSLRNHLVVISPEHLEMRWLPSAELADVIGGYKVPAGYLGAIRQAIDQPRSPSERVV